MDNQPGVIVPDNHMPPPAMPLMPPVAPPLPSPVPPPIKARHAHTFILGYITILILVAAIGGIYGWQHNKVNGANAKVAGLQGQVARLNSNAGSFTYTPSHANLSLTLPRSYGVVVNYDGCPCDKPYTGFDIMPRANSTVFNGTKGNDEIDVLDSYNGNLNSAAASEETRLKGLQATVSSVTNTTVAGVPAKVLTVAGGGSEYVIGSGKWLDELIFNGYQSKALKSDILKGLVIRQ